MVYSCKKFRHYLICYEFVFHVDHYALQHLVKKADLSGRIARYLLTLQCPEGLDVEQRTVFIHKAGPYQLQQGVLFKKMADERLCRCLEESEVPRVVSAMHTEDAGGHYATRDTVTKIVNAGLWWPTMFKDVHVSWLETLVWRFLFVLFRFSVRGSIRTKCFLSFPLAFCYV
ncbi:hypothetical protein AXG93_1991s1000 [Marchantia polymorpha subsp. ruderalis]|uniref:Reverse transcriptase RNase H-like domain-containing protein n=1 Tax=Marchantia polymorpha subsp. ruderalis TaxID=1480154 RepID=A0A176VQM4_MARPO|nr:hypothetical protein AXG93_1991s1000 [Marchantia polymorpha subsp. ruderalis]